MKTEAYLLYTCLSRKVEPLAFRVDTEGNILNQIPATAATKVMNFDGEVFSYRNCGDFDFFHTGIDTLFTYDPAGNKLLPKFTMTFPNMNEEADTFILQTSPSFHCHLLG